MRYQFVLGITWAAAVAAAASASETEVDGNWNDEEQSAAAYGYVYEIKERKSDRSGRNEGNENSSSTPAFRSHSDEIQRAGGAVRQKAGNYLTRSQHRSPTPVIQPYVVNVEDGSVNSHGEQTNEETLFDKTIGEEKRGHESTADVYDSDSNPFIGMASRAPGVFGERVPIKQRKGLATRSHSSAVDGRVGLDDEKRLRAKKNRKSAERGELVSLGKLSGPIVVPELDINVKDESIPSAEGNETSDTFERDTRPDSNAPARNSYVATSSNVLRPLQAGLALVDLPDSELISSPTDHANQDYGEREEQYEQERVHEVAAHTRPAVQSVEIQKSVELYHTAPVREIHYPVEYVPELGQARPNRVDPSTYRGENEIAEETRNSALYRVQQNDPNNRHLYEKNTKNDHNRFEGSERESPLVRTHMTVTGSTVETRGNPAVMDQTATDFGNEENLAVRELSQSKLELGENLAQLPNGDTGRLSFGNTASNEIGPRIESKLVLSGSRTFPVEKVIEKTVHVPHPIEIEKLVEKRIPYPVEKLIEKQVAIPQPYPVHVPIQIPVQIPVPVPIPVDRVVEKQIRIPQLYPVHVDRLIEKKLPFAPVQRFIMQSYPIHVKTAQLYPTEKQIQLPITVEKVIEKATNRDPYAAEISKFLGSLSYPSPVQYEPNYQQSIPRSRDPSISVHRQTPSQSKKYVSYGSHRSHLAPHLHYWKQAHVTVAAGKERGKDEYAGNNRQVDGPIAAIQSKSYATSETMQQQQQLSNPGQLNQRRARQQEGAGAFRQSKMEYGFKPPMVPSVQYDEKTATKVE